MVQALDAPARTASPVPGSGARSFRAILRANELCESGGRFVPSARPTTAAAPAGYGRAQLNTRNHVELLRAASEARLANLGTSRKDLQALAARGAAAQDWYAAVVGGESPRAGSVVGLREARVITASVVRQPFDLDALVAGCGEPFRRTTGLPPSELRFMASTRLLASAAVAREYQTARRAGGDRAAVLGAMTARHPELRLLRERLGDAWIERYWTDRRLAENRAAWYTRAAMTEDAAFERLMHALENGGDRLTSSRLLADNLRRALAFTAGLDGFAELGEADRLLLIGQLVRLRNLAPALFDLVTRSVGDATDLEERLSALRDDPGSSAGAALRAFLRFL